MNQSTAKKANSKNMTPTSGCLVQKHPPAANRRIVAIMSHCSVTQHCMRYWMEVTL